MSEARDERKELAAPSGSRRLWARRIKTGHYEYQGLILRNHGYFPPDQCIWWEAFNPSTGEADYHAHTKRELMAQIDQDFNENAKD